MTQISLLKQDLTQNLGFLIYSILNDSYISILLFFLENKTSSRVLLKIKDNLEDETWSRVRVHLRAQTSSLSCSSTFTSITSKSWILFVIYECTGWIINNQSIFNNFKIKHDILFNWQVVIHIGIRMLFFDIRIIRWGGVNNMTLFQ